MSPIRPARTEWAIAAVVAMTTALAACTATTSSSDGPTGSTSGDPIFEGPYAAEFAEEYQRATSEFERDVLMDGVITDAEYAEMTSLFVSCLADQGITFNGYGPEGGYSTSVAPNGGDTNAIVTACELSTGGYTIGYLHDIMSTNPDNLDSATIMAECLVRKGVVPEDYGADEYLLDAPERFADLESLPPDLHAAFLSCNSDPLGLAD